MVKELENFDEMRVRKPLQQPGFLFKILQEFLLLVRIRADRFDGLDRNAALPILIGGKKDLAHTALSQHLFQSIS